MKLKKIFKSIFNFISKLLGWGLTIFLIFTLGWRGFVGAMLGMIVIIMLLVTQNTMFLAIIELMGGSKTYNDTLIRGYPNEKDKTKND